MIEQIILGGFLVEALVQNVKWFFTEGWFVERIAAVVLGIAIAVLTGLDVFAAVGLPIMVPIVGSVLTGLLLGRGANFFSDFFKSLTTYRMVQQDKLDSK